MGAHHPEVAPRLLRPSGNKTNGDFCHFFLDPALCSVQCCKWSPEGDRDIADFLKFGPFSLREQIEQHKGVCRPATTRQSLCVTKKLQKHMKTDNEACTDDADRDKGGCERNIQATMEVTFYTGETGDEDDEDTWPLFQLQYVEMNDCVSQLDKIGQNYCWEADHDRYVQEFGESNLKPAGEDGYRWTHNCGEGSGEKECVPEHQSPGKCFWDGTPDDAKANQTTRDTQWSKNADDCVMWTACGVKKNGLPVKIEHQKGSTALVKRAIPAEDGDTTFDVKDSIYLYGHVTDITRESVESTRSNIEYNREVFEKEDTWLSHPPRRWVRVEIPVFNNVTYFFNVLRKVLINDTKVLESYTGVSAVTTFYHQTQLYSDTTILIIAAVVVVALLFLLIPFIFTKQKIKEHLRKVYEKHKKRGQARAKEVEGEAEKGDNVVKYAGGEADKSDAVVGYDVQSTDAAEKEDPAMRKKDSAEPTKGSRM